MPGIPMRWSARGRAGSRDFRLLLDADAEIDSDSDFEVGSDRFRRVGIRGLQGRDEVQGKPKIMFGLGLGSGWHLALRGNRTLNNPSPPAISPRCGARECRIQ
jgi:hypothetical protein